MLFNLVPEGGTVTWLWTHIKDQDDDYLTLREQKQLALFDAFQSNGFRLGQFHSGPEFR